ncbi:MAG: hypothetical protein JHD35_06015 [Sphingopyxis sp.]|nr:hypothetical protein [Sphingopyxis sp.]
MHDFLPFLMSLAAAATSPPDAAPVEPLEKIEYIETGPEGAGRVHWLLRTDGQGRYESDGSTPESVVGVDLDVGAEGFQKISAMLQPLEGRSEVQCDLSATDQAHGLLTFYRGIRSFTLYLDQGCSAVAGEDAFGLMNAANLTILDWAGTDKWRDILVAGRGPSSMLWTTRRERR